ncbi:hypothetical protein LCGC14_0460660, partial [marine sediment metagenome]
EKVLGARLSDAKFFWDNDLRTVTSGAGMETWVKALENVTFHNKLGTQAELIDRMATLSRELAPLVGADADEAEQAARVAKADLSSEMVYEFPELHGLMGSYYAKAAGKSDAIAAAAQDHYAPLGPSDDVPTAPVSVAVALAEKIDKLAGFWAIDEKPTGSKDPFALRRAALGVIRILVENGIQISSQDVFVEGIANNLMIHADAKHLLYMDFYEVDDQTGKLSEESWSAFEAKELEFDATTGEPIPSLRLPREHLQKLLKTEHLAWSKDVEFEADGKHLNTYVEDENLIFTATNVAVDLLSFLHDRLKVYLKDQGVRHDIIDACIAMDGNDDLTLLVKRAKALSETLKTDDGENLIQGFKRANNILSQAEGADGVEYSFGADIKFAETEEERALFAALDTAEAQIKPAMEAQHFGTAMSAMAFLRGPIDAFFDAVQVNSDNATIRRNRLNLLSRIRTICSSVADLTKIDG